MYIFGMALKTNLEMCELIQTAIIAVMEKGQSYTIGEGPESKTYTRADIGKLEQMYQFWHAKYKAENRGSAFGATVAVG